MPSRSLLSLIILISVLTGFVAGRHWPSPGDDFVRPPARPARLAEVDLLEREVGELLAERDLLKSDVRSLSVAARDPGVSKAPNRPGGFVVAHFKPSMASSRNVPLQLTPAPTGTSGGTNVWTAENFIVTYGAQQKVTFTASNGLTLRGTVAVQKTPAESKRAAEQAARVSAARVGISRLSSAIARFTRERKRSPYSLHELTLSWPGRAKGYLKGQKVPDDPWSGRYELRTTRDGKTRVVSAGPDGVFGTSDDLKR